MLTEIMKLKPGFHYTPSLIDALDRAQAGPRTTKGYETPSATLHESLTCLEQLIRTKVGQSFLKRPKADDENPKLHKAKERVSRKARAARAAFDVTD